MAGKGAQGRVEWVDAAKGICIILVVMMHSTLGVEKALGAETALNAFIEWARPFRMPDFFLISGLFLASRIERPWRAYLDTKVLHFAYFYVLWLTIQFLMKAPGMVQEMGTAETIQAYLVSFVDPFGTLWFIYLLAVFFVVSKLLRDVPKAAVLVGAALLHVLAPKTGSILVDEFTDRFVFFYSGYALASAVLAYAERVGKWPLLPLLAGLGAWAVFNTAGVQSGLAHVPGVDFVFSYAGIAAVVAASVLVLPTSAGRALAYCGRHSIAIYLAFTVFMGPTRILLLKLGGAHAPELVALAATLAGICGPLILRRAVAPTPFAFIFERPQWLRLTREPDPKAKSKRARNLLEAAP